MAGQKLGAALATAAVTSGLGLLAPAALAFVPLAAGAAIRLPDLLLARSGKRRQARIGAQVPELAELLLTSTEAGLGLAVALVRSSEVVGGALGAELGVSIQQVELGLPWRDALDALISRTEVASLHRLIRTLGRSRRLGVSIGTSLRSVADDLRSERRAQAEEAARRAPVKMLFPLVFLILPAFLLLTVGPVFLSTIRSLR